MGCAVPKRAEMQMVNRGSELPSTRPPLVCLPNLLSSILLPWKLEIAAGCFAPPLLCIFSASFCLAVSTSGPRLTQRWDSCVNTTWLSDTGAPAWHRDRGSAEDFLRKCHAMHSNTSHLWLCPLFLFELDNGIFSCTCPCYLLLLLCRFRLDLLLILLWLMWTTPGA